MESTINQVKFANYLFSTFGQGKDKTTNVEPFPSSSSKRKTIETHQNRKGKRRSKEKHQEESLPISSEMVQLMEQVFSDVDEDGILKDYVGSHFSQPLNTTSLFFPIASKIESKFTAEKSTESNSYNTSQSLRFGELAGKPASMMSDFLLTSSPNLVDLSFNLHDSPKTREKTSPQFSPNKSRDVAKSPLQQRPPSSSKVGITQLHHQLEIMYLRRKAGLEQASGNLLVASDYMQKALNLLLGFDADPLKGRATSISPNHATGNLAGESNKFRDVNGNICYEEVGLSQPALSSNPFDILQSIQDEFFLFDPMIHSKAGKIQRFYRRYLAKRIALANRLSNFIRGFLARLRYKKLQQLRRQCAILIQRRFRKHLIRMHALATKIKQWYKIRKIVREYQRKLFIYKMARHIQRLFRGFLGRKRAKWMKRRLLAALMIQRNLRAYRVRNDRHFAIACIHRVIFYAVRKIQTAVRRIQARMRCQIKLIMESIRHNLRLEKEKIVMEELLRMKKIELKYYLGTDAGRLHAYFLKRKRLYRKLLMVQSFYLNKSAIDQKKTTGTVPSKTNASNAEQDEIANLSFITPALIELLDNYDEFADGKIYFRHLINILKLIFNSSKLQIQLTKEMVYHLQHRLDPQHSNVVYISDFLQWFDSEEADNFFDEYALLQSDIIIPVEILRGLKRSLSNVFKYLFALPSQRHQKQEKLLIQEMSSKFFFQYYTFHFQLKYRAKFICCQCLQPFLLFSDYTSHFHSAPSSLSVPPNDNMGYCSATNLPANFFFRNYYKEKKYWQQQRQIEYEIRRYNIEIQHSRYFSRHQCFEEVISWNSAEVRRNVMAEREEHLFDLLYPLISSTKNLKAKIVDIIIHYLFLFASSINPDHSSPSLSSLHVNHHQSEQGLSDPRYFLNDIILHVIAKSLHLPLKKEWMMNERMTSKDSVPSNTTDSNPPTATNQTSTANGSKQQQSKSQQSQKLKQNPSLNPFATQGEAKEVKIPSEEGNGNAISLERQEVIKWLNRFVAIEFPFLFMQNSSVDGSYSDNATDQNQFAGKRKGVLTPSEIEKEGFCYDHSYLSFIDFFSTPFSSFERFDGHESLSGDYQALQSDEDNVKSGVHNTKDPSGRFSINSNVFTSNRQSFDMYRSYNSVHMVYSKTPTITRNGFYRKITRQVCHLIIRLLALLKRNTISALFALLEFRSKYPRKISLSDEDLRTKGLDNLTREKYDGDYEFHLKVLDLIRRKEKELDLIGLEKQRKKEELQRERQRKKNNGALFSFSFNLPLKIPFKQQYEAIHPHALNTLDQIPVEDSVPDAEQTPSAEVENSPSAEMKPTENILAEEAPPNQEEANSVIEESEEQRERESWKEKEGDLLFRKKLMHERIYVNAEMHSLRQNPLFIRHLNRHYVAPYSEMHRSGQLVSMVEQVIFALREIIRLSEVKEQTLLQLLHPLACKYSLLKRKIVQSYEKDDLLKFEVNDLDLVYKAVLPWFNRYYPNKIPPKAEEITGTGSSNALLSFEEAVEMIIQLILSTKNKFLLLQYLNFPHFLEVWKEWKNAKKLSLLRALVMINPSFLEENAFLSAVDRANGEDVALLHYRLFRRSELSLFENLPRHLPSITTSQSFWLKIYQSQVRHGTEFTDFPPDLANLSRRRGKNLKQREEASGKRLGKIRFSTHSEEPDGLKQFGAKDDEEESKLASLSTDYFRLQQQHSHQFQQEILDQMSSKAEREILFQLSMTQPGWKLMRREVALVLSLHQMIEKMLRLLIPSLPHFLSREGFHASVDQYFKFDNISAVISKVWKKLVYHHKNQEEDESAASELLPSELYLWKSLSMVLDLIIHFLDSSVSGSTELSGVLGTLKCFTLISPNASEEVLASLFNIYSPDSTDVKDDFSLPTSALVEHLLPFLRWQLERYSTTSSSTRSGAGVGLKSCSAVARQLIQCAYRQHSRQQLEQSLTMMNMHQRINKASSIGDREKTKDKEKERLAAVIHSDREKAVIIRCQFIAMRQVNEFRRTFLGQFYEFRIREHIKKIYRFVFFQIDDFHQSYHPSPMKKQSQTVIEEEYHEDFVVTTAKEYLNSYVARARFSSDQRHPVIDGRETKSLAEDAKEDEGMIAVKSLLLYGIYLHCEQFQHHYGRYQKRILNTELPHLLDYLQQKVGLMFVTSSSSMIHSLKQGFRRRTVRWYDSHEMFTLLLTLLDVPLSIDCLVRKGGRQKFNQTINRTDAELSDDTVVHLMARARQQAVLIAMNLENIVVPETNYRCFVLALNDLYLLKRANILRRINQLNMKAFILPKPGSTEQSPSSDPLLRLFKADNIAEKGAIEAGVSEKQEEEEEEEKEADKLHLAEDGVQLASVSPLFSNWWKWNSPDRSLLEGSEPFVVPMETLSYYLYARGYSFQDVIHSSLQEHAFVSQLPDLCEGRFQIKAISVSEVNAVINEYIWKEKSLLQSIGKRTRCMARFSIYETRRLVTEYLLLNHMPTIEQRGSEYLREILTGLSLSEL